MHLLIERVHETARAARTAREDTLPDVVDACRAIEVALQDALDGEPLRGLKNLNPQGQPCYAARVRSLPDRRFPHPSEPGGNHRFLVLSPKAHLLLVWWGDAPGDICTQPAEDDDFTIDDLEGLIRVVDVVLPRHIKAARRTGNRYLRAQRVAHSIRSALEDIDADD